MIAEKNATPFYGKFINYAHRGASEYAPENTLLSFYTGIFMGANGIETDIRRTKDGKLILFHDSDLKRVCNENGAIQDYTLKELKEFFVYKNQFKDKIITLEEFLQNFAFRDLTFAIELKDPNVGRETLNLLKKYNAAEKSVITSFNFEYLSEVADGNVKIGWLVHEVKDDTLKTLKSINGSEICPDAKIVTSDKVKEWHGEGFNVRAWGVLNTDLMESALNAGVDGMTVNFPDKLTKRFYK